MKSIFNSLLFAFFFGTTSFLNAQELLPKGLTPQEEYILSTYEFNGTHFTPAPTEPVQTSAQWEEVEYLLLRWTPNASIITFGLKPIQVNLSQDLCRR